VEDAFGDQGTDSKGSTLNESYGEYAGASVLLEAEECEDSALGCRCDRRATLFHVKQPGTWAVAFPS
jgi:hypothetical protein